MHFRERYNPDMERLEAKDTADAFNKEMEKFWKRPDENSFVDTGVYTEIS